jgi:allophanate hydrolase subunit 1
MMNALDKLNVLLHREEAMASESIVEVPVLLESWLLKALEDAASEQGMSTAEMVRRLIRDFVYYSDGKLHRP